MYAPIFKSFHISVVIDNLFLQLPVNEHKYDKFAITVNNDGLVELWSESCIDVGIVYSIHCGFYVCGDGKFGYDSEIPVGRIDPEDPRSSGYLNCIWLFERPDDGVINFISKKHVDTKR
ncbi:hypothetical protein F485_gp027 [Aeromonas phage CC2]|uniref:Uncharacterized protein n=1 Tax=Aeromonas phage CC2 TaxID=1204516 RepID=I6WBX7_9CAUD|nr:hypothetical protein F485_gp027 [Aeromonas phage CC2]AFN39445.1 hypothetical protein CC2_383 [Aeromonas phage CC2]